MKTYKPGQACQTKGMQHWIERRKWLCMHTCKTRQSIHEDAGMNACRHDCKQNSAWLLASWEGTMWMGISTSNRWRHSSGSNVCFASRPFGSTSHLESSQVRATSKPPLREALLNQRSRSWTKVVPPSPQSSRNKPGWSHFHPSSASSLAKDDHNYPKHSR